MTIKHEQAQVSKAQSGDKEALGLLWDAITPKLFGYLINVIAVLLEQSGNLRLQIQEGDLQKQIVVLKKQLAGKNASYSAQLNSLNAQADQFQINLDNLNKQTGDLVDNVATVQGNISINYINLFDLLNVYLTPYWLPCLFLIVAILTWFFRRNNNSFAVT